MAEGETMVKHILRSDDASAPETPKGPPNAGQAIARIKGGMVDETGKRGRSQFLKTRESRRLRAKRNQTHGRMWRRAVPRQNQFGIPALSRPISGAGPVS